MNRHVTRSFCSAICFAVFLSLCGGFHAAAQAPFSEVRFERYTTSDGLSDNHVLCILQGSDDFLWLGTRDGLCRFDAYSFRTFRHDPNNPWSISDSQVECIIEDRDGYIWLGTANGGVVRMDRARVRFESLESLTKTVSGAAPSPAGGDSEFEAQVLALAEDSEGAIWILDNDERTPLRRYDKKNGIVQRFEAETFTRDFVNLTEPVALSADADGGIWLGVDGNGLWRWDARSREFALSVEPRTWEFGRFEATQALFRDGTGALWTGAGPEFYRIDPRDNSYQNFSLDSLQFEESGAQQIMAMYRDSTELIWLGTRSAGLLRYNLANGRTDQFIRSENPFSLAGSRVYDIKRDRSGNMWIGTNGGLAKLTGSRWIFGHYGFDTVAHRGLSHGRVKSIYEDDEGVVWVGTGGGGLNRIDLFEQGVRYYQNEEDDSTTVTDNVINAIVPARSGGLWIGASRGLNYFDRESGAFRRYFLDSVPGLAGGGMRIQRLAVDGGGRLWIGSTRRGLYLFEPETGQLRRFVHDPADAASLPANRIGALALDREQSLLWVGTTNGLATISTLDYRTRRIELNAERTLGPGAERVRDVHLGNDGRVWLATGGGLIGYDPATESSQIYDGRQGLGSNIVAAILSGDDEHIWLSTSTGITRFTPSVHHFQHYTSSDGLLVSDFVFGAGFRSSVGELYFGGSSGMVIFHPFNVRRNVNSPRVHITGFRVFDEELQLDSSIVYQRRIDLEHDQNFFTIEFAALDFTNPQQNEYSYQLINFERRPRSSVGVRRLAQYTSVPPGDYIFRVEGRNNDGVAGQATEVRIVIHPAIYQTLWFRFAAGAIVLGALIGAILLRLRVVRERAELQGKVISYRLQALRSQMNPHFMFNSLNSIVSLIVENDTRRALQYLTKFARLMRQVLENSQRDLITLAEELDALRYYTDLEQLRFEHKYKTEFRIDPTVELDEVSVPPLLVQPYVENAILHGLSQRSEPGLLLVSVAPHDEQTVMVCVEDNGIGRKRAQELRKSDDLQRKSVGMDVTRQRLDVMSQGRSNKYQVEVKDLYDAEGNAAGTKVEILVPVD